MCRDKVITQAGSMLQHHEERTPARRSAAFRLKNAVNAGVSYFASRQYGNVFRFLEPLMARNEYAVAD